MEYVKGRIRSLIDGKNSPGTEAGKSKDNTAAKGHFEKVTPGAQPQIAADPSGGVVLKGLSSAATLTPAPKSAISLPWLSKNLITIMVQAHEGAAREGELRTDPGKKLNIVLDQIAKMRPVSADPAIQAEFNDNLKSELQSAIRGLSSEELVNLSAAVRAGTADEALGSASFEIASSHFVPPEKLACLALVSSMLAEHLDANANLELEDYEAALQSFNQADVGSDSVLLRALGCMEHRNRAMDALALKGNSGPKAEEQLNQLEGRSTILKHLATAAETLIEPLQAVIKRFNMEDPEHAEVHAKMTGVATAMSRLIAAHPSKERAVSDDKRDGKSELSNLPAPMMTSTENAAASEAIEQAFKIAICPDNSVVVNVTHDTFSPGATRFMSSQLNGRNLTTLDWQQNQRKSVYEQIELDLSALMTKHGKDFLGKDGESVLKQFLRDAVGTEMLDATGKPYFTMEQRKGNILASDLGQFRTDAGSDKRAFLLMMVMSQTVQSLISDLIIEDLGPGSPLATESGTPVTVPLSSTGAKLSYQCTSRPGDPLKVRAHGFFFKLLGTAPKQTLAPDTKQDKFTGDEALPAFLQLDPRKSFFSYTMDISIADNGMPTLDKPVSYASRLVVDEDA